MHSIFKIANGDSTCRCEIDEGTYEHYEIKDNSENFAKNAETQENVEWKDILGQKFKSGLVKIINTFRIEVTPSIEKVGNHFALEHNNYQKPENSQHLVMLQLKMA